MSSTSKPTTTVSSDAASTYSCYSDASTLKDKETTSTKKWFSLKSKPTPSSSKPDKAAKEKAIHYEAMATYLAYR
ncbi:hypothetical protein BDV25DRAFT_154803 [Aspergillus avenaceus]|uniref:Uncharacterized protein n=1 Tax=Aspergillus avenaceus TaxID=36643 RepID=A0A5N6TVA4_ASPAV|nr:hypothetical protein BDV25DRAFT_154803 [Aspergillus avenaceus]